MNRSTTTTRWLRLMLGTSLSSVTIATVAYAQDAVPLAQPVPAASAAPANTADIVVTGSRIAQSTVSPNAPIVTLSGDVFTKSGAVTLEDQLNRLPQLAPSAGATTNDAGTGGASTLSLRGLGANRTLVLMDGKRLPAFDQSGDVDINNIPEALIQAVDVVTGGSSAAYGSDAIAGVVNFRLNHHFKGVQLDVQNGISDRGDGYTFKGNLTIGGDFPDGSGNAVLSLGYAKQDGINNSDRKFSQVVRPSSQLPFTDLNENALNLPSAASVNGVFGQYGVTPGTVIPNTNFGVNQNGSLFTFGSSALNFQGGSTANILQTASSIRYNSSGNNGLIVPLDRYTAYGHIDHTITDSISAYAEANFEHYTSTRLFAPAGYTFTVPVTNPFIPSDLAAVLASRPDPNADFSVTRRFTDVGFRVGSPTSDSYRLVAGVKGKTGIRDWTFDVYGSYGGTSITEHDTGAFSSSALHSLLYAADGGASVCAGGLNIFQVNAGASCVSAIRRTVVQSTRTSQAVAEATLQGGLFALPAGEVRFALGTDYRRDHFSYTPDSGMASGDVISFNTGAIPAVAGTIEQKEAYAELQVPVLADLPLIKNFEVDLGYRYSNYNTFGGVNSYRGEANWEVLSGLHIRGGYARAVRAPSVGELYAPQSPDSPTIFAPGQAGQGDPCDIRSAYRSGANGAKVASLCQAQGVPASIVSSYTFDSIQLNNAGVVGGNSNLNPEKADTYTIGAAWAPKFNSPLLNGLSFSADYYSIKIKDAISSINGLTTLQKCYNLDGSNPDYSASNIYCSLIGRDPTNGNINSVQETTLNLGAYKTSGIDVGFDWHFGLGAVGLDDNLGNLRISATATRLLHFEIQNFVGSPFVEYRGTIGASGTFADPVYPKWKGVADLIYAKGGFSLDLQYRYISAMTDASLIGTGSKAAGTPAYSYFDLNAVVKVNPRFTLRAGVNNIGDKQPPVYPTFTQSNTNPQVYDVIGRRFYVGARVTF